MKSIMPRKMSQRHKDRQNDYIHLWDIKIYSMIIMSKDNRDQGQEDQSTTESLPKIVRKCRAKKGPL